MEIARYCHRETEHTVVYKARRFSDVEGASRKPDVHLTGELQPLQHVFPIRRHITRHHLCSCVVPALSLCILEWEFLDSQTFRRVLVASPRYLGTWGPGQRVFFSWFEGSEDIRIFPRKREKNRMTRKREEVSQQNISTGLPKCAKKLTSQITEVCATVNVM